MARVTVKDLRAEARRRLLECPYARCQAPTGTRDHLAQVWRDRAHVQVPKLPRGAWASGPGLRGRQSVCNSHTVCWAYAWLCSTTEVKLIPCSVMLQAGAKLQRLWAQPMHGRLQTSLQASIFRARYSEVQVCLRSSLVAVQAALRAGLGSDSPDLVTRPKRVSSAPQSLQQALHLSQQASFSDLIFPVQTSLRWPTAVERRGAIVWSASLDNKSHSLTHATRTCCSIFCARVSARSAFINSPRLSSDCVSSLVAFSKEATCCSSSATRRSAAAQDKAPISSSSRFE